MKKKTAIIVISIHTALILLFFPYEYFSDSPGDSWPFFFPMIIDLPVSVIFYIGINALENVIDNLDASFWLVSLSHFVLGAVWWLLIVGGAIKLRNLVKGSSKDSERRAGRPVRGKHRGQP